MLKKIEFNGEKYYFNDKTGAFLDSHFMELCLSEKNEVASYYFNQIDISNYNTDELLAYVKEVKKAESHHLVIKACELIFKKYPDDRNLIYNILPSYNSSCRAQGKVDEGIANTLYYARKHDISSSALYTTLAASYCDLGDYDKAYKYANRAYFEQGGSVGYGNELSLVFRRIQKETGDNPFCDKKI